MKEKTFKILTFCKVLPSGTMKKIVCLPFIDEHSLGFHLHFLDII